MILKGRILKGKYFDSVRLMIASKKLKSLEGIIDSSLVMGTKENVKLLKAANLYIDVFNQTNDTDLLIIVEATNQDTADTALEQVDDILLDINQLNSEGSEYTPKSIDTAVDVFPQANLALISVAGKYAPAQAKSALDNGLHVMIFSDNVMLEDEVKLKLFARKQELLVMGPDCGTAIINGQPLAFANNVSQGDIGIVSASGTGLQEVSSLITNLGGGISQALGTGGRDIKKEVGGIMFLEAFKALEADNQTQIIVLISKPPDPEVFTKIINQVQKSRKKIVAIFLDTEKEATQISGINSAGTLEESAYMAVALSKREAKDHFSTVMDKRRLLNQEIIKREVKNKSKTQKYLRGLFSGGTFCTEAQLVLKNSIGSVYSNIPLNSEFRLDDVWKGFKDFVIDLGEDEFTLGRLHPMIDYTIRNQMILEASKKPETAVLILDVVLGYGANLNPQKELSPVFKQVKLYSPDLSIICSVTGTEKDLQVRSRVINDLIKSGAIIADSNAHACDLAGSIIQKLRRQ